MIVDIDKMPADARVWIYQASQKLNSQEKQKLQQKIQDFLDTWDTHGTPLKAAWTMLYDRFLVLVVDDKITSPSGCSIDKSVRFLKDMEEELGIAFLEKSSVAILEENDEIMIYELKDLKKNVKEGKIKPNSLIFNNLVPTLGELETSWRIPASKSWISRYFNN